MILIGAGTGLAGLRAHLLHRQHNGLKGAGWYSANAGGMFTEGPRLAERAAGGVNFNATSMRI
jgi:hypothetical protein